MKTYLGTVDLVNVGIGETFVYDNAAYIRVKPTDWRDIETGDLAGAGTIEISASWIPVVNLDSGCLTLMNQETKVQNRQFVLLPEEEML